MHRHVTVIFDNQRSVDLFADVVPSEQAALDARDWFDAAWDTLGCVPLQANGKVLFVDKVMAVAGALGYDTLMNDAKESEEFARYTALALDQTRIIVDLPGLFVGY
jgi:hypothetical protein